MARRAGSDGIRTEAAIREAALRLIARHGYEAMSMRRLAEEIGLGAAALYRYFPNKQALLFDLLREHMAELLDAWDKARLDRPAPALARLECFTRFHIRHHLPRSEGVFLSYMELRSLTPENFAAVEAMRRRYEQDLIDILDDGQADGTLDCVRPRLAARAVIACLTGITTWYRPHGALSPREIEDSYWDMIARMCGARQTERATCSTPA